jgi:hypothetical protein
MSSRSSKRKTRTPIKFDELMERVQEAVADAFGIDLAFNKPATFKIWLTFKLIRNARERIDFMNRGDVKLALQIPLTTMRSKVEAFAEKAEAEYPVFTGNLDKGCWSHARSVLLMYTVSPDPDNKLSVYFETEAYWSAFNDAFESSGAYDEETNSEWQGDPVQRSGTGALSDLVSRSDIAMRKLAYSARLYASLDETYPENEMMSWEDGTYGKKWKKARDALLERYPQLPLRLTRFLITGA